MTSLQADIELDLAAQIAEMGVLDFSADSRVVLLGLQGGDLRFGQHRRCLGEMTIQDCELLFTGGHDTCNSRPGLAEKPKFLAIDI